MVTIPNTPNLTSCLVLLPSPHGTPMRTRRDLSRRMRSAPSSSPCLRQRKTVSCILPIATFNLSTVIDIQSRQRMETKFQSQIERVLVAVEELVGHSFHHPLLRPLIPFKRGHSERTIARSKKLEEFDQLATKALEERKRKYDEWKAWKPKPASSGWLRSKPRNSPTPMESTMVAAYDHAGK